MLCGLADTHATTNLVFAIAGFKEACDISSVRYGCVDRTACEKSKHI